MINLYGSDGGWQAFIVLDSDLPGNLLYLATCLHAFRMRWEFVGYELNPNSWLFAGFASDNLNLEDLMVYV